MKKILYTIILSFLLIGNAYSKTTSLICTLENEDKPFLVLLDEKHRNATYKDKVVDAYFSAKSVKFVLAKIKKSRGVFVMIKYEIDRVNLDVIQTLSMTAPSSPDTEDLQISKDQGTCKISKKLNLIF